MRIIVDGIIYGLHRYCGIVSLYNNVLPRLATREDTEVELLLPRICDGEVPSEPVRRVRRDLLPERTGVSWKLDQLVGAVAGAVNAWGRGLRAYGRRKVVFQSTYFTFLAAGVPHVAVALDMNHELFPDRYQDEFGVWLRGVYPDYLRRAQRIVAISHSTKHDVMRFYGIDESVIDVVHLAVDAGTFYRDCGEGGLRILQDQLGIRLPYLLYVGGRGIAYKNFARVVQAFERFARGGDLSLVVAGPRWMRGEAPEIEVLGLANSVRLIESPTNDVLRVLYSFAHAFVFPSLNEGFGIPLLEAMACGAPVLAASTKVFHEVAGDAALYFDPYDVEDLARGIESCFDEDVRNEFRTRGIQRVRQYSWDRCAAEMYAVYERALSSG